MVYLIYLKLSQIWTYMDGPNLLILRLCFDLLDWLVGVGLDFSMGYILHFSKGKNTS